MNAAGVRTTCILFALGCVPGARAQRLDARAAQSAALLRGEMARRGIPGLAVAVVSRGTRAWSAAFGLADVENSVPVTEGTVFRFASVSKPLTAIAVLRLVDAGRLSLEQRVSAVIPELPPQWSAVTMRHLLAHQSGMRHRQAHAAEGLPHYARLPDALRVAAAAPLLFEPGTRFGYSTDGYGLLGWVMETVTGRAFVDELRAQVLAPAGMTGARADHLYEIIPHRAQGYFRSLNGDLRNSEPMDPSAKTPGGGLCGTIRDLAGLAAALQTDRLLVDRTREAMWTPQRTSDSSATDYGLGWRVSEDGGHREVYHGGTQPRTSALIYLLPEESTALAILSNLESVDYLQVARQLARIWGARACGRNANAPAGSSAAPCVGVRRAKRPSRFVRTTRRAGA